MRSTLRTAFACAALITIAARPSDALQSRAGDTAAPPDRVVLRDGSHAFGALSFRWTNFSLDEPAPALPSGGDGGPRTGSGGRSGGGAGAELLRSFLALAAERDLGEIDRIESGGELVFQAVPEVATSAHLQERTYSGGYGGLAFDLPTAEEWQWVEATATSALAVRRDISNDIVGRVRLHVVKGGDGASLEVKLEEAELEPARLFRAADLERFASVESESTALAALENHYSVRRVLRSGVEATTGAPLHLECNLLEPGPLAPAFEVLARGERKDEVLAEARAILESVRFTRDRAVEPLAPAALAVEGEREGGGGRAAGGARSVPEVAESPVLDKGRYSNKALGVALDAALPEGWIWSRADARGFTAYHASEGAGPFDIAAFAITVLRGRIEARDPSAWLADRYEDGLIALDPKAKKPKPAKTKIGKYSAVHLVGETDLGAINSQGFAAWIEDGDRTVVIVGFGAGLGTKPAERMEQARKILKALKLSKPGA